MSDVKAFNNCMSVFWRQHEAEFSRFLTSKTGDSEKAADPEKTKVIIVTLAETTPVLEAANLQRDLRRAGIEPWAANPENDRYKVQSFTLLMLLAERCLIAPGGYLFLLPTLLQQHRKVFHHIQAHRQASYSTRPSNRY